MPQRERNQLRDILLTAEKMVPMATKDPVTIAHVQWLHQAGYLEAIDRSSLRANEQLVQRVTWKGCELLDAIRSETQWAAVTARFGDETAPFDLVQRVAFAIAAEAAGLKAEPVVLEPSIEERLEPEMK